jgi:hypothetical protein
LEREASWSAERQFRFCPENGAGASGQFLLEKGNARI